MAQLNAYLNFNGNCREAMTFYQSCLGGELNIQTFGESQMGDQVPPAMKNNVIHSVLSKDGLVLMASDTMGPGEVVQGDGMFLCVVGSSKAEIEPIYAKFAEEGTVGHPLTEEFFGTFGDLTDKFGVKWMFQANSSTNA